MVTTAEDGERRRWWKVLAIVKEVQVWAKEDAGKCDGDY